MYEKYTHQSLPGKYYRELLGSAICVFNSNNAFIIETILRMDISGRYDWYHLTDLESGRLRKNVHDTISKECGEEIESLFSKLAIGTPSTNQQIHTDRPPLNCRDLLQKTA